jgi:sec-independent protein translocase protein TatA
MLMLAPSDTAVADPGSADPERGGSRMMGLSPTQIMIVLLLALLLFGAKRLPEMGRGLGRSMREFRAGLSDGGQEREQADATVAAESERG